MFANRLDAYKQLEHVRGSKVLAFVTGDRPGLETKIGSDALDHFGHHLDAIGDVPKISLVLYTRGGDTLAAWSLVNLIRQFCKEFEIIIPSKAHSAGTLLCLGANAIMMTKQATLGPIDPSVNTPLNPQIPGAPQSRLPVSVENVSGYIEFAREALGKDANLEVAFQLLADKVHPLVLGSAFRARSQIRMLARKLLAHGSVDKTRVDAILDFLCSESGSHDYTINRREARDELGLPIVKPDDHQYSVIRAIFEDTSNEMALTTPFLPLVELGANPSADYVFTRALIESVDAGSHAFRSRGTLRQQQVQVQPGLTQMAIQDSRTFEGWEHDDAGQV